MKSPHPKPRPTATIYQNESDILIIFSKVDGTFRGSSTSFENLWCDGASSGLSGFSSRMELNQYLKDNHYKERGQLRLNIYCWSKHEVKVFPKGKLKGNPHGGIATCRKEKNHKGKHIGSVSGGFGNDDIEVDWQEKLQ